MSVEEAPQEFLTIEEAAALLRVHYRTIQRMLKSGELPARKIGREWRIHRDTLREFVKGK